MAMLLAKLEEILDGLPTAQAWLPDRFTQPDVSEEAWNNVFSPEKRTKKLADNIRKSSVLKSLGSVSKRISRMGDAHILSMFYGSEPMRGMMERVIQENGGMTLSGSMEWLTSNFLQANPYRADDVAELKELLEDDESEYASYFLDFIAAAADESFYRALKPRYMDAADLGVNLVLCTLTPEATLRFFDTFPWLAERQGKFIDLVNQNIEEAAEEDPAVSYANEMLSLIKCLFENVDRQRLDPTLQGHMRIRSLIMQIQSYHAQHGADSFTAVLKDDHEQMVTLLSQAGEIFKRYKIGEAMIHWAPVMAELEALPKMIAIDTSSDEQIGLLESYMSNRHKALIPVRSGFRDFHASVGAIERHMEKLSSITQNGDGSLDEILKLNEELLVAKGTAVERAAEIAPIGSSLIKNASTMIYEIERLRSIPKIDFPARTKELEEQVTGLSGQLEKLQQQFALITQERDVANQNLEKERDRRISQEESATVARREAHDLRTAMASIGKNMSPQSTSAALPLEPSFVVELMKGSAKLTPEAVLTAFSALYPQDLVVLESAIKSAKAAYNFEMGNRLAALVQSMVDYLGSVRSGRPDAESRTILGSSYASHESDTVVNNVKLRSQREFVYEGEKVVFLSHVSVGRGYGTQHQIRLYFKIIDDKMVIAYCGERLDSATTS